MFCMLQIVIVGTVLVLLFYSLPIMCVAVLMVACCFKLLFGTLSKNKIELRISFCLHKKMLRRQ